MIVNKNIIGKLLVVATLLLPSISFAFSGVQLNATSLSTTGVLSLPDRDISCSGSETVHQAIIKYVNDYSSYDISTTSLDSDNYVVLGQINNVTCGGGIAHWSAESINMESTYSGYGTSPYHNKSIKYALYYWTTASSCTWTTTCSPNNAVAGNIMLYRIADGTDYNWYGFDGFDNSNRTRFLSHSPVNEDVVNATSYHSATTTTSVTISADIYLNDADTYITKVCFSLENLEHSNITLLPRCEDIISSAVSTLSTTFSNLTYGRYSVIMSFSNSANEHISAESFEFVNQWTGIQNQTCAFGLDISGLCSAGGIASSSPPDFLGLSLDNCSAMSDLPTKALCSVSNAIKGTVNYVFIPSGDSFQVFVTGIRTNVITHWPIGYITDFVSILSTTTESSLPVIDVTLPQGMLGRGSHVRLELNHIFDFILYATTTSMFSTASTTNQTFFDYTNYYWQIVCYVLAVLYIIYRTTGLGRSHDKIDKIKKL